MWRLNRRATATLLPLLLLCAAALVWAGCRASDGAGQRAAHNANAAPPSQAAVNPPPVAGVGAGDDVRRVTVAELKGALERGEAVVIDVRDQGSYRGGHIKGSLWMPKDAVERRLGELPQDKLVVTYCA